MWSSPTHPGWLCSLHPGRAAPDGWMRWFPAGADKDASPARRLVKTTVYWTFLSKGNEWGASAAGLRQSQQGFLLGSSRAFQHSTDRSCYWDLADARGSFWTEIKRNVFKRVRKENLHNLVLYTMTSLRDFTSRPFCYLFLLKVSWKQRVHGLTAFLLITRHWFFFVWSTYRCYQTFFPCKI
jgi:hypothetical protein